MRPYLPKRFWITVLLLGGYIPGLTSNWYYTLLKTGTPGYWVMELSIWALLPGLILWTGLRYHLFDLRRLGMHTRLFNRPLSLATLGLTLGLILLWLPFNLWLNQTAQTWLSSRMISGGPLLEFPTIETAHLIKFAYLAFSAGVVEEFYGRSVLGCLFDHTPGQLVAYMLVSALVFALIHWEGGLSYLSFTFVWGLVFGAGYAWIRSVWPLMLAHALYDWLVYCGVTIP